MAEKSSPVTALNATDSGYELPTGTGSINHGFMEEDKVVGYRITQKIDVRLVPMLCALYLTAYLDRTNIGNAKLLNLDTELKMPSNGYNTAVWVFYLTFVLMEVPSNMLMTHSKIPPNWVSNPSLCSSLRTPTLRGREIMFFLVTAFGS